MSGNGYSRDKSGAVVTAAMVLLAVLGVVTVFHGTIAAVLFPPAPGAEGAAPTGK